MLRALSPQSEPAVFTYRENKSDPRSLYRNVGMLTGVDDTFCGTLSSSDVPVVLFRESEPGPMGFHFDFESPLDNSFTRDGSSSKNLIKEF